MMFGSDSFLREFFGMKPHDEPPSKRNPEKGTVEIRASDDLLQRAKVIVWCLGYRGAIGDYVLGVYDILKQYEELDKKEPKPNA